MALEFENTSTDRVYDSIPSDLITDFPFTMACWAKTETSSQLKVVMSVGNSGASTPYHALFQGNNTTNIGRGWSAGTVGPTNFPDSAVGTNPITGEWYSLVGVWYGVNSIVLYVNGVPQARNTQTGDLGTINRVGIGVSADSSPFGDWDGFGCEYAVWNSALSQESIRGLSRGVSPALVERPSLIHYRRGIIGDDGEMTGNRTGGSFGTPIHATHPRILYAEPNNNSYLQTVLTAGGGGWTGIVNGVTNPGSVNGVAEANISTVNGVSSST